MMDWINQNILTIVVFAPLVGALVILLVPRGREGGVRALALIATILTFIFSLHLVFYFQNQPGFQFGILFPWIPGLGVHYAMGIDGFSLWLILLTTFLMPLAVLFSTGSIKERQKSYYFYLLVLETGMLGSFAALDVFLFYIFWEAMLIPMYFLIGIYGYGRKIYAALKFFIFTMAGSVLMLLGMIYLYYQADQSFLLSKWMTLTLAPTVQVILFALFALSFAIKVPIIPMHTWLPDAHTEAPTAGSVILAGVLLKMGTYGFVRFAMPLFPQGLEAARPVIIFFAVMGILYGALVAMVQKDMKRLVAYSSIAHLGFVMLGLMALTPQAVTGAVYQMINHGLTSGGLFLLVGMIYDRTHTRMIADYGGIGKLVPVYTFVFMVVTLASIALPGTNSFIGEFLILSGSFETLPRAAFLSTIGVILSAVYMLWMVERVFFGPVKNSSLTSLKDMNLRELVCMVPILILIIWMGVKPHYFLEKINLATYSLIERVQKGIQDYRVTGKGGL